MDRISKLLDYLKENETDSFLRHALALEYIKIGKDVEAGALFEKILEHEPGYVGTYYHLAKLHERQGEPDKATAIYEAGMKAAKQAGDNHSFNELRGALDELES